MKTCKNNDQLFKKNESRPIVELSIPLESSQNSKKVLLQYIFVLDERFVKKL